MKRIFQKKVLLFVLLLILIGFGVWWFFIRSENTVQAPGNTKSQPTTNTPQEGAHPNRIRLIAAGDFIPHDSVNMNAKQSDGTYDYLPMMQDFQPIFSSADIRFCNDPILHGGEAYGIVGYPKFNSPTSFVDSMSELGCNVIGAASNHSFDKGQGAIDATVVAWQKKQKLAYAGINTSQAEQDAVPVFTVKGVKFAFLSYTTYLNQSTPAQNGYGVNVFSREKAAKQIAQAKQQGAEVVIVSMRWGTEYSPNVNAAQQSDAQFLASEGVDVVLGHGPHVLQPVQKLTGSNGNETIVWYSLGNFINTQLEVEGLFNGLGVIDFDVQTKKIAAVSYLPLYMHYEWTPSQKASEALLSRKNLHMYTLDNTTQDLIDSNQLDTTVEAQKARIQELLNQYTAVPILTTSQYNQ